MTVILPQDVSLAPLCTAFRIGVSGDVSFSEMCLMVMREPTFFMALNDLIAAITLPHAAAVNCARAVESIRNCIAPPSDPPPKTNNEQVRERKEAWGKMQRSLRLEQAYLSPVTNVSLGPRHGNRKYIPGPLVQDAVTRTWIVMNRFMDTESAEIKPCQKRIFLC